ncbi:MAG: hypothetical protein E7634_07045 [Ruminococcaceae bacterium]|nr:hypothetical protein [Oscillospiraceae bacterium]
MKDSIEIINLVPRFLDFYGKAKVCDGESRFETWKKHYGFAAVPPGEEGELLAKELLDSAWDKYEKVIPFLEQWSPDAERIEQHLSKIKSALNFSESVDVVLIFFVGAFDENAFAAPYGKNRIAVCLPIENGENQVTVVHELIHLVHGKIIGSAMNWERSVASLIFQEGLATQLSKYLVPGHKDEVYVEHQDGWLQDCSRDSKQILQRIRPFLQECSAEKIFQFTMGNGTTGRTREGYFAGWKLIGDMLDNGWSFSDIARVKEDDMARVLMKACSF